MLAKLLAPIIDQILDKLGLQKRLDDIQAQTFKELEELRDKAFAELEETRDKSLQMLKDALPQMAGEVSKAAVTEVFKATQADETVDRVAGVFTNILDQLPFGIGRAR